MAEFTQDEIETLKAAVATMAEKKTAKPTLPRGSVKILLGEHGRMVGRVLVTGKSVAPEGFSFINDNPDAKIGNRVGPNDVMVTSVGREYCADIVDADGEVVNRIVVNEGEPFALDDGFELWRYDNG